MSEACSLHGDEKCLKSLVGKLEGKTSLEKYKGDNN
jgi:hypothetical protein